MTTTAIYNSPIGAIYITEENGFIVGVSYNRTEYDKINLSNSESSTTSLDIQGKSITPLLRECISQLEGYFNGTLRTFDLPMRYMRDMRNMRCASDETEPFALRVYKAVSAIPYGETATYKQIAAAAGNDKAYRAAGNANHNNPLPILVPCHRVCGTDGQLHGYNGGIERKIFLLNLERKVASGN